jgi:cyclopropane-fatty-acyl-phospholipid synthase
MDYRDVPEDPPYDKIASVGMFEHVGRRNLPEYFAKIHRLLRPGGLVMNHGITSTAVEAHGLGSGIAEFVDEYVFPGGELTHVSNVMQEMAAAGLEPLDAENLRPHYARTLWSWVERLESRQHEALELIGEQKYRIWRIYMAGSAYAFEHNWMALFQILGGRPHRDGTQDYPFNRRHVYGA